MVHQGSGVGHISEHGEPVASRPHIKDSKHPAAVRKIDLACSHMNIVETVAGIENKAGGGLCLYFI